MEYLFGTVDNENDIILSLPLQDVRNYSQLNRHKYDTFKKNKMLDYKLKQAQQKVNRTINLLKRKPYQGVWLNTMDEYELFGYYNNLLNFIKNTDDFTELNNYKIVVFEIQTAHLTLNNNYFAINLQSDDDDIVNLEIEITNLELKEFLLHLYYDNKIL